MNHGTTSGYTQGCRCDPCATAKRDYMRGWQTRNRERVVSYSVAYARRNPDVIRSRDARRRVRRYGRTSLAFTQSQLADRMAFFGNRCWQCAGPFEHVDHVKPLSKGGVHMLANLRPSCARCNQTKGERWPLGQ